MKIAGLQPAFCAFSRVLRQIALVSGGHVTGSVQIGYLHPTTVLLFVVRKQPSGSNIGDEICEIYISYHGNIRGREPARYWEDGSDQLNSPHDLL